MAVTFLIGRSGTGKTHRIVSEIASACAREPLGPPIILLVPEQSSYQTEHALLESGKIDGYCRARVLSFTRIADFVFSQSTAPRLPRLTTTHRSLLATLVIDRKRKTNPGSFFQAPGLEEAFEAFISESRQYGADVDRLRDSLSILEKQPLDDPTKITPLLQRKLAHLVELVDEYERTIAERFQDPQDTLRTLADTILQGDIFQAADIYIDGFLGFTPIAEKLLLALAKKAHRTTISLLGDPARSSRVVDAKPVVPHNIFRPVEETLTRLLDLFRTNQVEVVKPVYTEIPAPRFHSSDLATIEGNFLSRIPAQIEKSDSVEFHIAEDPRDMARAASETVARWIEKYRWPCNTIAIMARDLDAVAPHIEENLAALKIPCFMDRSLPLSNHPMISGVTELIRAALHPERPGHLIALGKSGFIDIDRANVDFLEHHVSRYPRTVKEWYDPSDWSPRPSRSPFEEDDPVEVDSSLPKHVEATRRTLSRIVKKFRDDFRRSNPSRGVAREFLSALVYTIDQIVREHPPTEEDETILQRIGELLGEEHDIIGDDEMTWELAGELTIRALSNLSLPRIPPLLGQVFVGQVDRSRLPPIKGMILLGLNEGEFPHPAGNMSLLNDAERELLDKTGLELRPPSRRQFEREALHAYRGLTAASERLAVFRTRSLGGGTPAQPSPYWENLREIFPNAPVFESEDVYTPARCWRARELAASSLRQLDETHLRLRSKGMRSPLVCSRFPPGTEEETRMVLAAAKWRNKAALSPDAIAEAYGTNLFASATQLESFNRCPFQHYVSYFLRPSIPMQPAIDSRDIGSYCHAVLRNFTRLMRERKLLGQSMTDENLQVIFSDAVRDPRERIIRGGLADAASGKLILEKTDGFLWRTVRWLQSSFVNLPLRPQWEEARFHTNSSAEFAALEIPLGKNDSIVTIRGQIDRVDVYTSDGKKTAVCIDYKLRQKSFDFQRWLSGENLQLPIYLLALGSQKEESFHPAGGLYLELVQMGDDANLLNDRKLRGLFRSSEAQSVFQVDNWTRVPYIQGSSGNPDEAPRSWGTIISDKHFDALLEKTLEIIRETSLRILSGDTAVHPSRFGKTTACAYCDYRPICGVDFRLNRANVRPLPKRVEILESLAT